MRNSLACDPDSSPNSRWFFPGLDSAVALRAGGSLKLAVGARRSDCLVENPDASLSLDGKHVARLKGSGCYSRDVSCSTMPAGTNDIHKLFRLSEQKMSNSIFTQPQIVHS